MKKIAVVLCGSGFKDGSEIRESVASLWALSQPGIESHCFAPDADQVDVVNCFTGASVLNEKRNMLVEAARIARGNIKPLSELDPKQFSGILLPGGFGVAKNLCTFASKGSQGEALPELQSILNEFYLAKKPIGAICIAPAVLALSFIGRHFDLTVGEQSEASAEIEKLGHRHIVCQANSCVVDEKNKIVTTPAYMYDRAPLDEVFSGIKKAVDALIKMS
ncbi:MAG: isoprenoid biosynthesis glyoxalase ElbB [Bacteriovoracia bacterium]